MNLFTRDTLYLLIIGLAVIGVFRALPVQGFRRLGAVGLRLVGLVGILLSLQGVSMVHRHAQPRHVLYLVDQSTSIDARTTAWIARRLASLEAIRPSAVSRTVVAFGKQAHLVFPSAHTALTDPHGIQQALTALPIERDGTNLEAALLACRNVIPIHEPGRVILLSDGRQTIGSVERILPHLRRFGLEVYPVPVAPTEPTGLVWEQLAVPSVVQQGASVPIKLVFTNGTVRAQSVDVTVTFKGVPIAHQRTRAAPGWRVVTVSVPAIQVGTMPLDVSVAFPQGSARQQRTAYVEVEGPPQLLMVFDRPTELPLLATALKRRQMGLAVATTRDFPTDIGKLLEYDAVVLFHIPKSAFSETQVDALSQYVERFGGGVVMVGLGGMLNEELAHDAPLDRLLPVRFEAKGAQEAKRRVCILMLIDRSASMMGPRIAATKRAAVELVKQLASEDLVGVLAFDTVPYVVVEVQQAQQVTSTLIDKLVRLKSTGGTDIFPALKAAQQRLLASGATVKHMMLLSDGNTPVNTEAYQRLLTELRQQQITLSTVGIGSVFVNATLLDWLAAKTGGAFYQMRTLDELPQLIARDTQKTLGELPFAEGYFRPIPHETSQWFPEVTEWPTLKGYLTTTAKSGATVELAIRQAESTDPLLAHWSVGGGQVAVFTSDADTRWSPEWIRWPSFESVWAQVLEHTMRPRPTEELFVWTDEHDGMPHLVIEGQLDDPTATLVAPNEHATIPLALVQQRRFRWVAPVGHVDSGWYRVIIESHPSAKPEGRTPSTVFARRWIQIGHMESQVEQPQLPPDEVLLRHIAQATDGVFDVPDGAFLPPTEWINTPMPLRTWLLPLVLLFLLVDVALRGRTML